MRILSQDTQRFTKGSPMKALVTRYHGPTNTLGARISVRAAGCKPIFYNFDYAAKDEGGRFNAASQYCYDIGWHCAVSSRGEMPNGDVVFTLKGSEC